MRCGKECSFVHTKGNFRRNPHECAVAKTAPLVLAGLKFGRNPHECAVAKLRQVAVNCLHTGRNPHECAVAKLYPI